MSAARLAFLSLSLIAAPAAAEETFVTQLRLSSRDASADTFAWREGGEIFVERSALQALSIVPPRGVDDRVALSRVPGLSFQEDNGAAMIVLECAAACFDTQRVGVRDESLTPNSRAVGAYLNYDVSTQWRDGAEASFAGVAEANVFGPFGRIESSMIGRSDGALRGFTRLETRWTWDSPAAQMRLVIGDASAPAIGAGAVRFGGVQIGRRFALTPNFITYPTPAFSGEAAHASTVELYIDGALRAREAIRAGPFAIDSAPFVTGAGEAQIVVTDLLGRQQTLTRPFFVSRTMLRSGLTDWSLSLGRVRDAYGQESGAYGEEIAAGSFRMGVTNALTFDMGAQSLNGEGAASVGATMAHEQLGQVRLSRAQSAAGAAHEAEWRTEQTHWSLGLQWSGRDPAFEIAGYAAAPLHTFGANAYVDLGVGAASFTAGRAAYAGAPSASVYTLGFAPELSGAASLNFSLSYLEQARAEFRVGVGLSVPFGDGALSSYSAEGDRDGIVYRVSAQRGAPAHGGAGWRMRASTGAAARVEVAGLHRGALGDTQAEAVRSLRDIGLRLQHSGSVGWVDDYAFAGAPVRGAFAIVDVGASGIDISRDRLGVGRSNARGRLIAANLRPYDVNTIGIDARDVPLDRVLDTTQTQVVPAEGAGVVVRFGGAARYLEESRVILTDGAAAPRGTVLVRLRDGARFPVGAQGRVVISDLHASDQFEVEGRSACRASAGDDALILSCGG